MQHDFKVMPFMLSELEPGIGLGNESESITGRARILELDFWRLRRHARNKKCYFKRARGEGSTLGSYWLVLIAEMFCPARPPW